MENYIIFKMDGSVKINLTNEAIQNLKTYRPKGCPFNDYTMLDLLFDLIKMYSWSMISFNRKVNVSDYIKNIMNMDAHTEAYGSTLIKLLEV